MYMCVCIYVCMYVCVYVCMYACMHACIYVSMYLCIYVSMYVCMYVCCMYVYAHMHIYLARFRFASSAVDQSSYLLFSGIVHRASVRAGFAFTASLVEVF